MFGSHTSLTVLTLHPLWHMIEVHMNWYLVNLPLQFNSVDNINSLCYLDDYAKESKFRLELAHSRARLMLDYNKIKQKIRYDKNSIDFDLKIRDQVLLKNETGHILEFKYIGRIQ